MNTTQKQENWHTTLIDLNKYSNFVNSDWFQFMSFKVDFFEIFIFNSKP